MKDQLGEDAKGNRWTQRWTGRRVWTEHHENEVHSEMIAQKIPTNTKSWIGRWQSVRNDLWKALPEEDRNKYDAIAIEWNKKGVPQELKNRYVTLHCVNQYRRIFYHVRIRLASSKVQPMAVEFAKGLKLAYGATVVMLVAHPAKDGKTVIQSYAITIYEMF